MNVFQRVSKIMALFVLTALILYSCGDDAPTPDSWTLSTIESIGVPYGKTSLAFDSNGKVHISYTNDSGELRYATNVSGIWNTTPIGTSQGNSSIAVDSNDKVHVCYRRPGSLGCASNATGSWVINTVDIISTGNTVSLTLDSGDNEHVGYDTGTDIKYARGDGSGGWIISTVNTGVNNWFDIAIALDSGGNVHMSYDITFNNSLLYTTNKPGFWNTTIIDDSLSNGYFSGQTSVAVDLGDHVHIIYNDTGPGQIKYATNKSGVWVIQDVPGAEGQDPAMALDSLGNAHVSYYGCVYTSDCDLMYATNASGAWVITNLDSPGGTGARSCIAVDSDDRVHISYHSYDFPSGYLKYATNR